MKNFLLLSLVCLSMSSYSQNIEIIEKELVNQFNVINYWSMNPQKDSLGDSLLKANDDFENLLLKLTSLHTETITYPLRELQECGLTINTSADHRFRIYSWNTSTGGTMSFYRNVFQYKGVNKIQSKAIKNYREDDDDGDCFYYAINQISSGRQKYYLAQSIAKGSSIDFYHSIKVFSIINSQLNDKAKIIKTASGMTNELGYEVDLRYANIPDNDFKMDIMNISYDNLKNIIYLPLINGDGRITKRKIAYQFNGHIFIKL